jgi:hypothetical protein
MAYCLLDLLPMRLISFTSLNILRNIKSHYPLLLLAFATLLEIEFSSYAMASHDVLISDIMFNKAYIGVNFVHSNTGVEYAFGYCDSLSGRCEPLSSCSYSESDILNLVSHLNDENVRKEFRWIFLRSDRPKVSLDVFFPSFKALLERVKPECVVQDLPTLKSKASMGQG